MNSNKVLVSPSSFGQCGNKPSEILKQNNFEIVPNPYGRKLTEVEVIELAKDCVGIVAGVEPLNKTVLDALTNLKCISRVGVGMDNVDLEYAKEKNIKVVNTPDGPTLAVAELTIGLTFALARKISQADSDIKNGIWKKQIGNLVSGKTIGIIGIGRIGKKVAEMFVGIGNKVIGYDIMPDPEWGNNTNVSFVDLNELLEIADIVCLNVPASGTPIIKKEQLSKMKSESFLINVSRGGVVNESDLFNGLKNNQIAGAAIDVFDQEPYSGPFTELANVILTPHIGSYAKEGKLQMEIDAVNNLINQLK
jgi:D-3-phosphoglycerate dehydrogenase / 2-oxoglutarate reductase